MQHLWAAILIALSPQSYLHELLYIVVVVGFYISMPPFVADPMSDLPHVIQLSKLTRFVEELHSTEVSFHPSQSDSITDEFLRTVNHVCEIYNASDMDVFFRAVYKFFKRQVDESQPLPEGLQRLGKTYSKVSRTRALLNCMSRLQDAQHVYNEVQETYYEKVQALLREEIHAHDAAYLKVFSNMRESSRDLGMFTKLAGVAAEALDWVQKHGVYWSEDSGTSPLLEGEGED
ncbi:hypothetical protein V8D89_016316 [Ganoderma adspersum]